MTEEDLEYYYEQINDNWGNVEEVKKIIKQIWQDAQDDFNNNPNNRTGLIK